MRQCSKCGESKPLKDFYSGWQCKECRYKVQRAYDLKTRYGLTLDQYEALWEKQNGMCGLCGCPLPKIGSHLDHDHKSKETRGILHYKCNYQVFSKLTLEEALQLVDYLTNPPARGLGFGPVPEKKRKSGRRQARRIR